MQLQDSHVETPVELCSWMTCSGGYIYLFRKSESRSTSSASLAGIFRDEVARGEKDTVRIYRSSVKKGQHYGYLEQHVIDLTWRHLTGVAVGNIWSHAYFFEFLYISQNIVLLL